MLFVGMFLVAGVGFMSCEKNSGPSGGGGGGSSDGGSGTAIDISDTLPHCWKIVYKETYEGVTLVDSAYMWATAKEVKEAEQENKEKDGIIFTSITVDKNAKDEFDCELKNYDDYEKVCWRFECENSTTEYIFDDWCTARRAEEICHDLLKEYDVVRNYYTSIEDKDACEEMNGNDPEPSVPAVYIKHPWGTGMDESWSWEQMNYDNSGEYYYYYGAWGGVGANINDAPTDADAVWYPEDEIYGANNCSMGDYVEFRYVNGSLSVYLY